MLHEFLTAHREELISRCRDKVSRRLGTNAGESELTFGITYFLEQLVTTLEVEETAQPLLSLRVSGPSGGGRPGLSEIGAAASKHGGELLRHGFTIDQVVHDYGDLCQSVTTSLSSGTYLSRPKNSGPSTVASITPSPMPSPSLAICAISAWPPGRTRRSTSVSVSSPTSCAII